MRVYKNTAFAQFCRKNNLEDETLRSVIVLMEKGLTGADLGGGVYKQRIPRKGQGKSGGYRSIVLLRHGKLAMFVYGYAKNERANIDAGDLQRFRKLAKEVFQYGEEKLEELVKAGVLHEI